MSCPFCSIDESRIAFSNDCVIAIWDGFPVSPGHLLIVPRRHVPAWAEPKLRREGCNLVGNRSGHRSIIRTVPSRRLQRRIQRKRCSRSNRLPLPLHIIPRYEGDVADPRGGVRHVIPTKQITLRPAAAVPQTWHSPKARDGRRRNPLLPHLLLHLDRSTMCDIAVAFLLDSGARMIVSHLRDFLARGGRARILVGDYLDVTEPAALRRLNDLTGDLLVRVSRRGIAAFILRPTSFKPTTKGIAFVGSSNLSAPALTSSIEWNYKVISHHERAGFSEITAGLRRYI